ncbi:NADPH-dependent FMN reductase [Roseivivax sediminis]|uniref:NAD(P)H-dependent FMN reductase n=1 Tax=Roseivivax sediminis TaxID=936889 RepID=A0A1I2B4M6_9RHOB|nr:NADPH-dependent FMN reductase [Roseivivax sediminis]SFE51114.1 NAD(P)H-dependent FMN reductase [Roseivivax sediminis]
MTDLTLVGLCGALRAASTNRMLMHEAARRFGPARFEVADLDLPLYDGDVEAEGIPPKVQALADLVGQADAVIVCTPEYNKGMSAVLKNALEWISRTEGNPWRDTPVALMSAAAGMAGGERAQNMARLCLNPFRPRLLPGPEVFVRQTAQKWTEDGRLNDETGARLIDTLMSDLRREAEARRT